MPPKNVWSSPSYPSSSSRRRFLQVSTAAAAGTVLTNCARNLSNPKLKGESGTPSPSSAATSNKTLNIYGWTNYTDNKLLKDFEAKTGIRAVVDTFDSNETMLAKMQAGGGNAYSIIFPSDYMVVQMVELGMLNALDKSRLKGLGNLKKKWQNPIYDQNNTYSIPAAWGTTGLIYDPKRLGVDLKGWDGLWNDKDALSRKITLINDVREVMGATLRYLGYSLNTTKANQIEKAYDKLVELKPAIASFITNGWEDQLASGDLLVSMAYSVDAITLIQDNPHLDYVIPQTGASLWTDTMVIPKTAPNVDGAYEWLNFMLEPSSSASLVERLKFATPNQATFDQLSPTLKNDARMFPSEAVLAKCEGIAPIPPKVSELYDRYWTQLTSA